MVLQRQSMKFLVPLNLESLGRSDLVGRAVVPFYINPLTFSIQESKIINDTLTKGGYVIQYWGENLSDIQVSGTTGSGGIEAINVLRSVYRNEITQFNNLLLERAVALDEAARRSLSDSSSANTLSGAVSLIDEIFTGGQFPGGGLGQIINGVNSSVESITNAIKGANPDDPRSVELIPSTGAFAVSVILYFQGEKFTGYFKGFSVNESANSPGIFEYNFSFNVIKRSGQRNNFMPWHRKARNSSGEPVVASMPEEGQRLDELTFESNSTESRGTVNTQNTLIGRVRSTFTETQESANNDINRVSISRNLSIKGR